MADIAHARASETLGRFPIVAFDNLLVWRRLRPRGLNRRRWGWGRLLVRHAWSSLRDTNALDLSFVHPGQPCADDDVLILWRSDPARFLRPPNDGSRRHWAIQSAWLHGDLVITTGTSIELAHRHTIPLMTAEYTMKPSTRTAEQISDHNAQVNASVRLFNRNALIFLFFIAASAMRFT